MAYNPYILWNDEMVGVLLNLAHKTISLKNGIK